MSNGQATARVVSVSLGAIVPHEQGFVSSYGQSFTQSRVQPTDPESVTPAGYYDLGQAAADLNGCILQLRSFLNAYTGQHSRVLCADDLVLQLVNPTLPYFDEYVQAGNRLWVPATTYTRQQPAYIDMATGQAVPMSRGTRTQPMSDASRQMLEDSGVDTSHF